jgi:hypothetical protein
MKSVRYLVFAKRRAGKKKRAVDVVRIYPYAPVAGVRPIFEAQVSREYVFAVMKSLSIPHEALSENVVEVAGEDPDFHLRRLVIYTGVRQHLPNGRALAELVAKLSEVESVFWYSKFVEAFERGYWEVYRVAKSFRTLYRL